LRFREAFRTYSNFRIDPPPGRAGAEGEAGQINLANSQSQCSARKERDILGSSGDVNAVPEYRAYTVGADEHFVGYEPLVCADDAEAIENAKRLSHDLPIELWSGARFVIRLEPKTK
jgi:hypothetical protein